MSKKHPKFKVGDTVWYISEWDETNTPRKGKIQRLVSEGEEDQEGEITYSDNSGSEYVYFDDQCVCKTRKETLLKLLKGQIECTKDSIKRKNNELFKLQIKLAKIT